jgi:uncharacterized membrane protein
MMAALLKVRAIILKILLLLTTMNMTILAHLEPKTLIEIASIACSTFLMIYVVRLILNNDKKK